MNVSHKIRKTLAPFLRIYSHGTGLFGTLDVESYGPEVIKLCSCSTHLSMMFFLLKY